MGAAPVADSVACYRFSCRFEAVYTEPRVLIAVFDEDWVWSLLRVAKLNQNQSTLFIIFLVKNSVIIYPTSCFSRHVNSLSH